MFNRLRPWLIDSLLLLILLPAYALAAESEKVSQLIFQQLAPFVFQITSAIDHTAPKASYGSGFVVSKDGLLATNYHVVASSIYNPKKYKIFLNDSDQFIEARVVGLDVVRDLALLRVAKTFDAEVPLVTLDPPVGEPVFSLGIPKDLNLSIVGGIYNGILKSPPYERIQMSTPINPGMSGGPTVNSDGKVVGVNVAVLRNSQNITFSVPASYLHNLIERSKIAPLAIEDEKKVYAEIEGQLTAAQDATWNSWKDGQTAMSLAGWKVLKPPSSMKCWADKDGDERKKKEQQTEIIRHNCSVLDSVYLNDKTRTGVYAINYVAISNKSLNRYRFFSAIHRHYAALGGRRLSTLMSHFDASSKEHTRNECGWRHVVNSHGIPLRINYCLSGYHKYKGVLNGDVKMVTLSPSPKEALMVSAQVDGFVLSNFLDFIDMMANSIRLE